MAGDGASLATDLLINHWPGLEKLSTLQREHEITLRIDLHVCSALIMKPDHAWIDTRLDHKVIFKVSLAAIEDEIHAWVHMLIHDPGKGRNVGMPLLWIVADEIVGSDRPMIEAKIRFGIFRLSEARVTALVTIAASFVSISGLSAVLLIDYPPKKEYR